MIKYSSIVQDICQVSWEKMQAEKHRHERLGSSIPEDLQGEIDGWIGISCVLAFLQGTKPTATDMAAHFGVHPECLDVPLKRLIINGVFSLKRNLQNDQNLLGKNSDSYDTRMAWSHLAGVSAGFCGLR